MALRQCGVNSAVTATKASAEPGSKSTPPGRIINAFTGCNVFEKVLALYQFLKDYLNHLGVLLTAIVIVLACSLRGEPVTVIWWVWEERKFLLAYHNILTNCSVDHSENIAQCHVLSVLLPAEWVDLMSACYPIFSGFPDVHKCCDYGTSKQFLQ